MHITLIYYSYSSAIFSGVVILPVVVRFVYVASDEACVPLTFKAWETLITILSSIKVYVEP